MKNKTERQTKRRRKERETDQHWRRREAEERETDQHER